MDRECFVRLNEILSTVDAQRTRQIKDLRDISEWFEEDEEEGKEQADELRELVEEADMTGMLHVWPSGESRQEPSLYWDWTTKAHRLAQELGVSLVNPQGDNPLFAQPSNRITLPAGTIQNIDIGLLVRNVPEYLNHVYEDQTRYVIFHQGKPVAAVLPLPDLEIIKDLAVGGYVDSWVEWNRNVRDRLLWPPAAQIDEEADE